MRAYLYYCLYYYGSLCGVAPIPSAFASVGVCACLAVCASEDACRVSLLLAVCASEDACRAGQGPPLSLLLSLLLSNPESWCALVAIAACAAGEAEWGRIVRQGWGVRVCNGEEDAAADDQVEGLGFRV